MSLLELPIQADQQEPATIPFGEWLPDQATLNNPGAVEALNVVPLDGSYGPFPQLVAEANSASDVVRGAASAIREDDVTQIYVGSIVGVSAKLGGGPITSIFTGISSSDYSWKFVRVNEQMALIHPQHALLKQTVGGLTAATAVGGTPPTAACGAQVGDFLMVGDLTVDPDDGGIAVPNRVRWSGFNNIDLPWITDPATQADFQDMPKEGGAVVAIAGREVGTIYQQRMIHRATYRGLPEVFDIVVAEDKRGCIARDSVVDVGQLQFFIAEDGFAVWNGVNSQLIGDGRVSRYFLKKLEYSKRSRIVGAADFANGCVHWLFPTSVSDTMDEIITYSYKDNKFSHTQTALEWIFSTAKSNITLDELTEPLESYEVSFDSPIYRSGGRPLLAGFNETHTFGLFEGSPMAATLDTGEYSGPDGRRVFVSDARPLVDVATPVITMQTAKRDQMIAQPIIFGTPVAQEIDGRCPIIDDARYMRFRVNIPAGASWQHALGVDVWRKAAGAF